VGNLEDHGHGLPNYPLIFGPQLKQEDFHQIIRLLHENRVKKATTELGIQD
jgi:hypothetical protein